MVGVNQLDVNIDRLVHVILDKNPLAPENLAC